MKQILRSQEWNYCEGTQCQQSANKDTCPRAVPLSSHMSKLDAHCLVNHDDQKQKHVNYLVRLSVLQSVWGDLGCFVIHLRWVVHMDWVWANKCEQVPDNHPSPVGSYLRQEIKPDHFLALICEGMPVRDCDFDNTTWKLLTYFENDSIRCVNPIAKPAI